MANDDDDDNNVEDEEEEEDQRDVVMNSRSGAHHRELEPGLEQELCELWDMSVERAVCEFLAELPDGLAMLDGFVRRLLGTYPRAVECLLGVLVNMATLSPDRIAPRLAARPHRALLRFLLLQVFVRSTDVQCILQTVQLFNVLLTVSHRIQ